MSRRLTGTTQSFYGFAERFQHNDLFRFKTLYIRLKMLETLSDMTEFCVEPLSLLAGIRYNDTPTATL
jgi:hypothetical protein